MSTQIEKYNHYFKIACHGLIGNAAKIYNVVMKYTTSSTNNRPFLFYGLPGTGKSETSKRIAGIFTDYTIENILHYSGTRVTVDTIKNILDTIHYMSIFGNGKKCIIIEEIDQMSIPAQNLLLHLIDILPDHVLVIASSNHYEKLQDRLQSRFFVFEFMPAKIEDITQLLESKGLTREISESIANGCNGDIRQAMIDCDHAKILIDINAA